jgi:hypothetical protein
MNRLESMLERLEESLGEQIEHLTQLRGEALEEHALRGFHVLLCAQQRVQELGEGIELEGLQPLLRRVDALVRRSMALLVGEQRRQHLLIPALWPQTPLYQRSGRIECTAYRSGGDDDRLC